MSSSEVTKNDRAWAQLFAKYNILKNTEQNGYFEITSAQINDFREARLMTKFDHKINLPRLFTENNLAILPVTRGRYIISHFEAYKDFEPSDDEITRISLPEHIESIDYENITSESTAINCAYVSGILADFLEDKELIPTVSGRMSSGTFSFNIRNTSINSNVTVNVVNSQIEIDGGYEGVDRLSLIEAKNYISDDFLIRQLYYPYRLWSNKLAKKITPVFMVYSNGVFTLYEYDFHDKYNYNSLFMKKQKKYSIDPLEISLNDIISVLNRVKVVEEPAVPFPQADNFKRVINLCELLIQGAMTKDEITLNYAFDPRQTNYYTDAGRYLGLIDKQRDNGKIVFSLSEQGQRIVRSKYKARQLRLVEAVLKHRVFNETLRLYLKRDEMPRVSDIVEIMKKYGLYKVKADSTFRRRASTVVSWISWILELQK
ncbi:MAG TPA: transcriptional regulator [Syntrophomonadaceae bacterium]|nr:transcriptional regulator [Syntrophomonadaceae bacterium]